MPNGKLATLLLFIATSQAAAQPDWAAVGRPLAPEAQFRTKVHTEWAAREPT